MAKIYVAAVDCSFNNCGWSIIGYDTVKKQTKIENAGLIDNSEKIVSKKDKSVDDLLRSQRLYEGIVNEVVSEYTALTTKKAFALEIPGGSQSSRAASCLGMARGVLGSVITEAINQQVTKHCIVLIKPTEVHKKATGSNTATKEQIMDYVCKKYESQIGKKVLKNRATYTINCDPGLLDGCFEFNKGQFEHIADSLVIAELGLERLMKS